MDVPPGSHAILFVGGRQMGVVTGFRAYSVTFEPRKSRRELRALWALRVGDRGRSYLDFRLHEAWSLGLNEGISFQMEAAWQQMEFDRVHTPVPTNPYSPRRAEHPVWEAGLSEGLVCG